MSKVRAGGVPLTTREEQRGSGRGNSHRAILSLLRLEDRLAPAVVTGDYRIDSLIDVGQNLSTDQRTAYYKFTTTDGLPEVSDPTKNNFREIFGWLNATNIINTRFVEFDTSVPAGQPAISIRLANVGYASATVGGLGRNNTINLNPSYDIAGDLNGFRNGPGSHGYAALVHELGHTLGLGHSFSGTPGIDALPTAEDHQTNSVMTYTFSAEPGTFVRYDVLALQYLYGSGAHNTGDTTYAFNGRIDTFSDAGRALSADGLYDSTTAQLLWDSGGIDTLDFSALTADAGGYRMDLRPGGLLTRKTGYNASADTNDQGGSQIAYGVSIENVVASPSNDDIVLNAAANRVRGYPAGATVGNDVIFDATTADTLDLTAYKQSAVALARVGNDLQVTLGANGSVTVKDYYAGRAMAVQYAPDGPPGNTAPILAPIGAKKVNEGRRLSFSAKATDTDRPANTLTFTLDAGAPSGATITPRGAFTWTPTEAQGQGTYSVTVRVSDGFLEDFETFTITVNEVNQAPKLAKPGTQSVTELQNLAFALVATDSDLSPGSPQALSYSISAGFQPGMTLNASTGAFSWTPNASQAGRYVVTFRVTDAAGATSQQRITITVLNAATASGSAQLVASAFDVSPGFNGGVFVG